MSTQLQPLRNRWATGRVNKPMGVFVVLTMRHLSVLLFCQASRQIRRIGHCSEDFCPPADGTAIDHLKACCLPGGQKWMGKSDRECEPSTASLIDVSRCPGEATGNGRQPLRGTRGLWFAFAERRARALR